MIDSVIIPLVKNKISILSDKENYKPIAQDSVVSKILFTRSEEFLWTSEYQFGFKKGHSTDWCINLLKECIEFCKQHDTPVFVTFLDAFKAFDNVNHFTLFNKLLGKGMPIYLISIIAFWYQHEYMSVG